MQVVSCCFTVREWKGSASTDAVRSQSSNIGHWIGSVRRTSGKEQDFIVVIGGIWGGEKLGIQRLSTRIEEQHSRFDNKIKGLMKIRVKWRIQVVM